MLAVVNERGWPPQVASSRRARRVSEPPATYRLSGRLVRQAESDAAKESLAAFHLPPSTVVPLNSSDQTRPQVGAGPTVEVLVVGAGAGVVRGGVVASVIVVVGAVGVALGAGVVGPAVRLALGALLGGAMTSSSGTSCSMEIRRTVRPAAAIRRKTPRPTRTAWTLPANDTSPMSELAGWTTPGGH